MYAIDDLEELLTLTRKQVYDRLRLLEPVLNGHITTGKKGKKLLSEQGFTVFRRLQELERQGLTCEAALKQIEQETNNLDLNGGTLQSHNSQPGLTQALQERIEEQTHSIAYLQRKVDELMGQLTSAHQEIRALSSGPKPESQHLTRWQAFRIAIFGH